MEDLTGLLISVTLIEMMLTIGLGVQVTDLRSVARDTRLLAGSWRPTTFAFPRLRSDCWRPFDRSHTSPWDF